LRRNLKIKAYTILVAWLMIFMHNIIPHNHLQENFTGSHQLVQSEFPDNSDTGRTTEFNIPLHEISVCHISNFLYHNFNPDHLIIHTIKDFNVGSVSLAGFIPIVTEQSFVSDHFYGSALFRAPPAA
jgi:hypothetical protein